MGILLSRGRFIDVTGVLISNFISMIIALVAAILINLSSSVCAGHEKALSFFILCAVAATSFSLSLLFDYLEKCLLSFFEELLLFLTCPLASGLVISLISSKAMETTTHPYWGGIGIGIIIMIITAIFIAVSGGEKK
jgi:hypothetical protein